MRKTRIEESELIIELSDFMRKMNWLEMAESVWFHYQCLVQWKSWKWMYKHNMQWIINYLTKKVEELNNIKRKFEKIIKKV